MTIPDFQTIMLPLLMHVQDGNEHHIADLIETLADDFNLTSQERQELLPSGKQERFNNRVHWSRQYLYRANLIESTGRGKIRITPRGVQVLVDKPERIDLKYLERFPEIVEFRRKSLPGEGTEQGIPDSIEPYEHSTPDEALQNLHKKLKSSLAAEILLKIKSCSPSFFEKLVVDLLVAMGYGGSRQDAGQAVGKSRDGGIDGIIKEDRLGLDVVYIQAKRWDASVGRPIVQGFAGSLDGVRAKKGVLITTSSFSSDAEDFVGRIEKKIVLIDGETLANYMIEFNIGVAEVEHFIVKKLDLDYFEEE